MTEPAQKRAPQVFDVDDPVVIVEPSPVQPSAVAPLDGDTEARIPTAGLGRIGGIGWMSTLIGALVALAGLAASLSFAHFVSIVLARDDWLGLIGWGLIAIAGLAGTVIVLRELIGLMRLGRISRLRRDAEAAYRSGDIKAERRVVSRLRTLLAGRPDLAWAASRFAEHERDVRDKGELLALADKELVAALDGEARRHILAAAKRVSMITAISPIALIAVGYVLVENLRLMRTLAGLYGGRPGYLGALRLARTVIVHMIATGGVALTDDLLGQFIGQDLVRRLSRRLGEGLFNGALTARVGTVALEVCRPLPFIAAQPVRVRDIVGELMRRGDSPRPPAAS